MSNSLMQADSRCMLCRRNNPSPIWWFGQNGYIFKSPEGTTRRAWTLYLTDSCNGTCAGSSTSRPTNQFYVDPEDLRPGRLRLHAQPPGPHRTRRPSAACARKDTMQFVGARAELHHRCSGARGSRQGRIVPASGRLTKSTSVDLKDPRHVRTLPTDRRPGHRGGSSYQFADGPKVYVYRRHRLYAATPRGGEAQSGPHGGVH